MYDNATIDIVSVSTDEWSMKTEAVSYEDLSCRVESVNRIVTDQDGRELMAQTLLIINPETIINWDDKIKIKTIDGETLDTAEKKYVIKSKFKATGFVASHWEVYI